MLSLFAGVEPRKPWRLHSPARAEPERADEPALETSTRPSLSSFDVEQFLGRRLLGSQSQPALLKPAKAAGPTPPGGGGGGGGAGGAGGGASERTSVAAPNSNISSRSLNGEARKQKAPASSASTSGSTPDLHWSRRPPPKRRAPPPILAPAQAAPAWRGPPSPPSAESKEWMFARKRPSGAALNAEQRTDGKGPSERQADEYLEQRRQWQMQTSDRLAQYLADHYMSTSEAQQQAQKPLMTAEHYELPHPELSNPLWRTPPERPSSASECVRSSLKSAAERIISAERIVAAMRAARETTARMRRTRRAADARISVGASKSAKEPSEAELRQIAHSSTMALSADAPSTSLYKLSVLADKGAVVQACATSFDDRARVRVAKGRQLLAELSAPTARPSRTPGAFRDAVDEIARNRFLPPEPELLSPRTSMRMPRTKRCASKVKQKEDASYNRSM